MLSLLPFILFSASAEHKVGFQMASPHSASPPKPCKKGALEGNDEWEGRGVHSSGCSRPAHPDQARCCLKTRQNPESP